VARHDREHSTTSVSVDLKKFAGVLINDSANELFFADKVIVCEGFDDYILRAIARAARPKALDAQNVSIISVGGRDNISKTAKLVLKLGVKCYVLADFDYLLRDAGDQRKKYGASAHQSVLNLGNAFFSEPCAFGDKGLKTLAKLQQIRAAIKKDEEEAFYTAKSDDDIKNESTVERLSELRTHGVAILSGEIEDLCIGGTFSGDKKLSLDRIFELNQHLVSGELITDIFETSEIVDFLEHVLSSE
jgi:putative ATP-dependent endonuclease of OLD family